MNMNFSPAEFVQLQDGLHEHEQQENGEEVRPPPPPPSIIACLWRLFRLELIGAMVIKLGSDLLSFANPLLLHAIISFTEQPHIPASYGYDLLQ